jgi:hypothetical protein
VPRGYGAKGRASPRSLWVASRRSASDLILKTLRPAGTIPQPKVRQTGIIFCWLHCFFIAHHALVQRTSAPVHSCNEHPATNTTRATRRGLGHEKKKKVVVSY